LFLRINYLIFFKKEEKKLVIPKDYTREASLISSDKPQVFFLLKKFWIDYFLIPGISL